ncbi:MAG: glycine cleavage system aminomethyltransferase GcvT [Gemmatimonadaceae bacterium]|nr:glycine cleavage system aminomethyltransferase GcvT [Gemmatimonadaceae bacterium]
MTDVAPLLKTPLHAAHVARGAKMVPFAGWDMPVQYAGLLVEHKAVRERCGLFDVSHMGEVLVRGPDAAAFLDHVTDAHAHIVDDFLIYRFPEHFLVVVNASNREKDIAHLRAQATGFHVVIEDLSDWIALIAVQGPEAQALLQPFADRDLGAIRYYRFEEGAIAGRAATISRTGYTGEDGFELYVNATDAQPLWDLLLDVVDSNGVPIAIPCGLGARDTLRLEAGLCLYGNELDDATTPLDAGLGWLVKLAKGPFLGSDVLAAQKANGVTRKLVGFTMDERAIPRHGMTVLVDGVAAGVVASGTQSPTLGVPIGTAFVPPSHAAVGSTFAIDVRGRAVPARVVPLPFYKRPAR